MSGSTELWAVSIRGPDDLIPCDDYPTAIRFANIFNRAFQDNVEIDHHPYDSWLWATPIIWPYSAESHSSSLAIPSVDYAKILEEARKTGVSV